MQKYQVYLFLSVVIFFFISACEQEEDSPSTSPADQSILGNWAGTSEQGLLIRLKVDKKQDSTMITNYEFSYLINDDTGSYFKNDPEGIATVLADTFNFSLVQNDQNKGKARGKLWNSNYVAGDYEINEIKGIYHFNYTASKIGNSVTIHSVPQYSLVFEDISSADYTYVKGFFASHDTIHSGDVVVLSSAIYYEPTEGNLHQTLLEIKLGSLPEEYTAVQLMQLIKPGFISFDQGAKDGVEVIYRDKTNNYKSWSTSFGSANQENSAFNLSELYYLSGTDSTCLLYKFTANFNCMLYDVEGNSKKIVNAFYVGLIGAGF